MTASSLLIAAAILWFVLRRRPKLRRLVFIGWLLGGLFHEQGIIAALVMMGIPAAAETFGFGWGASDEVLGEGRYANMPEGWVPGRDPVRAAPEEMRQRVFARDGYCCNYCGAGGPGVELHADHIIPWSEGGYTTDGNLCCLCEDCNLRKGTKSDAEARMAYTRRTGFPPYMLPLSDRLQAA